MRYLLVCISLIFVVSSSYAQQDPQFSQNMFNRLYVNPAYAGASNAICAGMLYRNQWVDFEGAPQTGVLSIDAPVKFLRGGLGLTVLADEIGFENTLQAKLAYAFRFKVGQSSKLAIGADVGLLQRGLDGTFIFNDPGDPVIPEGSVDDMLIPDVGAGIYFNSDKAYLGASASHLIEGTLEYGNAESDIVTHFYGMGGYSFELNPTFTLTPSFLVKSDQTTTQADVNLLLNWNQRFWIGGSYRIEDAIVGMVGFNILKDLRLGYSYDFTTSPIRDNSSGTHEITLGYCFKVQKPEIIRLNRNVRFL